MCIQFTGTVFIYTFPYVSKAKKKKNLVNAFRSATENMYLENERTVFFKFFSSTYQMRFQCRVISNMSSAVSGGDCQEELKTPGHKRDVSSC